LDQIQNSDDMVYADPTYRKNAILFLMAFAFIAFLLIDRVKNLLEEIQNSTAISADQAIEQIKTVVIWMAAGNGLISVVVVAFLIRIGARVLHQGRFPPRGMKVLRDTPIRREGKAKLAGIAFFVAALLVVSTNTIWIVMFFWIDSLAAGA